MTTFDPARNHSQLIGGSLRKWVQDGVYFDKNFEPIAEDQIEQEMPAVLSPTAQFKAEPVPRKERYVG